MLGEKSTKKKRRPSAGGAASTELVSKNASRKPVRPPAEKLAKIKEEYFEFRQEKLDKIDSAAQVVQNAFWGYSCIRVP